MEKGCIFARKNAFTHRYGYVKQNYLTGTPPPYAIRERGGGLAPHPPRKEKNDHYSVGVADKENKRKTGMNLHLEMEKTLICIFHFQNGKS